VERNRARRRVGGFGVGTGRSASIAIVSPIVRIDTDAPEQAIAQADSAMRARPVVKNDHKAGDQGIGLYADRRPFAPDPADIR